MIACRCIAASSVVRITLRAERPSNSPPQLQCSVDARAACCRTGELLSIEERFCVECTNNRKIVDSVAAARLLRTTFCNNRLEHCFATKLNPFRALSAQIILIDLHRSAVVREKTLTLVVPNRTAATIPTTETLQVELCHAC